MAIPLCNQADLFTAGPRLVREIRRWDEKGYEQTQRRNGAVQCPRCGLWWPMIEEPYEWNRVDCSAETYRAIAWEGFPVCEACNLLMVEQPDGTSEVYQLR